ncbi:Glycine cleavage system transcriptional activator [compost metagenome]
MLHDAHNFWPDFIAEVFHRPLPPGAKNVRFNQTSLAIDAAIGGQGLALASEFFVHSDLRAGRLALAFDQVLDLQRAFYLVWPRNAHQPPALATVRAWLLAQAML